MFPHHFFGETLLEQNWLAVYGSALASLTVFTSISRDQALVEKAEFWKRLIKESMQAHEHEPFNVEKMARSSLKRIKLQRKMTAHQAQSFVLTSGQSDKKLEHLKGLLLVCAFEHERLLGTNPKIQRAFSAWRLLAQNSQNADVAQIIQCIPDPSKPLDHVVHRLHELLKDERFEFAQVRLLPIRRLLDDLEEQGFLKRCDTTVSDSADDASPPTFWGTRTDQRASERGLREPTSKQPPATIFFRHRRIVGDDDVLTYQEYYDVPTVSGAHQNPVEFTSDHSTTKSYLMVDVPADTPEWMAHSRALSAMQAYNTLYQVERREKKLVTSGSGLTRFEISTLLTALRSDDTETEAIRATLKVMLITGRRFEPFASGVLAAATDSGDACFWHEHSWYWRFMPELPEHVLAPTFQKLVVPHHQAVTLSLAGLGFLPLGDLQPDGVLKHCIDAWLKALNQRCGTRLTLDRVADYLGYYLHHLGHDDAVIALLTGQVMLQQAGVFHLQYDVEVLQTIHAEYVARLFGGEPAVPKKPAGLGGSQLVVSSGVVSALLEHQRLVTEQARGTKDLVEFHNRYALYTVSLLNLSSGHRPVKDPFDDFHAFDLIGRKMCLSDQEIHSGNGYRTLVIPQLAIEQVDAYRRHLEAVEAALFWSDHDVALSIQASLNSEAAMFFLLEDQAGLTRLPIEPHSLHRQISTYFDLPLNWHRHYLRTTLSRWNVPGECIDTFMGHAKPGQDGLARFSGMSIKSLQDIADRLDEHFNELNIHALPGWGHHG